MYFFFHVFKIDNVRDAVFWELMWDNKIPYGVFGNNKEEYIRNNCNYYFNYHRTNKNTDLLIKFFGTTKRKYTTEDIFNDIKRILKPYGYFGFEYSGGIRIGGCGRHRAFSIWDEDFVNNHKVDRFK